MCVRAQKKRAEPEVSLPQQRESPPPEPETQQRKATIVADAPVSLRVRATLDSNSKDFNGALVCRLDEVEILMSETVEGTVFYYIKAGKKKGFIKADYVATV